MNWNNLNHFLELVREGSTNRAAKKLGVHHTTVARRIDALEEELGTRLFDRSQGGFAPTQAAEDILAMVREIEELAHGIERQIYGQDAALHGSVRLTTHDDFARAMIVPRLTSFLERYPGIEPELVYTADYVDLNTREADIAVRLTARPPEHLIGRRIAPLALGVYASRGYLERERTSDDILLYAFDGERPDWALEHFPGARVACRSNSLSTLGALASAGAGIARLPCFYADLRDDLLRLPIESPPTGVGVWILTHTNLRATARVRAFKHFLEEVLVEQRALIAGETSRYHEGEPTRQTESG